MRYYYYTWVAVSDVHMGGNGTRVAPYFDIAQAHRDTWKENGKPCIITSWLEITAEQCKDFRDFVDETKAASGKVVAIK